MLTVLDVQLTKDFVPVIYHDFQIRETGTDSPLHTLNLKQVSQGTMDIARYCITFLVYAPEQGTITAR